jgi:hypothetical protein
MVFTIFGCLFVKKIQNKISVASIKSFTNFKNPSSNPFQGVCSGFLVAAMTLKLILIAACDLKIFPKADY